MYCIGIWFYFRPKNEYFLQYSTAILFLLYFHRIFLRWKAFPPQFVIIIVSSVGSRMAVLTTENSIHPNKYVNLNLCAVSKQHSFIVHFVLCLALASSKYLLGWILFSIVNTATLLPTDETLIMTNWGGNRSQCFSPQKILWK